MKKVAQDERVRPPTTYNWNSFPSQRQLPPSGAYSSYYGTGRGVYTPPPYHHGLETNIPNMYLDNYNYQHSAAPTHTNPSAYQYSWPYYK